MSTIVENWKAGLGLPGVLVIDGHVHIGEWRHAATFQSVGEAVSEAAAFMDANGVDAACVQSGGYMFEGTDYRLGNDFLIETCSRLPDRLVPFASVNPNDDRSNILAELKRVFGAGVRGIKLINSYQEGYPGDGPNLMAVYEFATEQGMLVFNHSWASDVLIRIATQFPDADFIFGHYGRHCDPALRECGNVYANIWVLGELGWLDRGIADFGAGKFMMGSDGFLNPMSVGIGPVVFAPVSDDEKRAILGLNMARLLNKVGALPGAIGREYGTDGGNGS